MNAQTLTITGTNLLNNQPFDILLTASNPFMLGLKYQNLDHRNLHIEGWRLVNTEWECENNHPINAGAYLCGEMEELTGLNLA